MFIFDINKSLAAYKDLRNNITRYWRTRFFQVLSVDLFLGWRVVSP